MQGMRVRPEGPQLISQMVTRYLNIDCSVLMGANIASGIAAKELSEATIGYNDRDNGLLLQVHACIPLVFTQALSLPKGTCV